MKTHRVARVAEVIREVHYTTERQAGRGAVREICELLLEATVGWPPPDHE